MKKITLIALFPLLILGGCTTTKISQSNLYWGNYSHTLYEVKKTPSDETKAKHYQELQSIVEKSKELNLRVPPGVYAELGVYSLEKGDTQGAKNFFQLEETTYPESSVLMKRALDM